MRSNLTDAARRASNTVSRGSVRDFDDEHLMQELKAVDVYRAETATNEGHSLERWQMVGLTAVPLKQDEEEKQQQGQQSGGGGSDSGQGVEEQTDQPKGDSAEAVMLYVGANRAHPIAMVDDRRVRPYAMQNGEGAHYAPNGSGQMAFHKVADKEGKGEGYYLLTRDGKAYGKDSKEVERMVSMRHVEKELQSRKIQKKDGQSGAGGQQQEQKKHKHEGDSVNTEVRVTKKYIEMYTGEKRVARYDKDANVWEINESGGAFKIIIDAKKILCQHKSIAHSMKVDADHVHIKYGGNAIFVDASGCWSSKPIQQKPDPDG
jgi:phage gp45-like